MSYPGLSPRTDPEQHSVLSIPSSCEASFNENEELEITCWREHVVNSQNLKMKVIFGAESTTIQLRDASFPLGFILLPKQKNVDGMSLIMEQLKICQGYLTTDGDKRGTGIIEKWSNVLDKGKCETRVRSLKCRNILSFDSKLDYCPVCIERVKKAQKLKQNQSTKAEQIAKSGKFEVLSANSKLCPEKGKKAQERKLNQSTKSKLCLEKSKKALKRKLKQSTKSKLCLEKGKKAQKGKFNQSTEGEQNANSGKFKVIITNSKLFLAKGKKAQKRKVNQSTKGEQNAKNVKSEFHVLSTNSKLCLKKATKAQKRKLNQSTEGEQNAKSGKFEVLSTKTSSKTVENVKGYETKSEITTNKPLLDKIAEDHDYCLRKSGSDTTDALLANTAPKQLKLDETVKDHDYCLRKSGPEVIKLF